MSIVLKRTADGRLQQIQTGESIQADSFERLSGSGNLVVGSSLGSTEELRLGSTTALVRAMGDAQVDGQITIADTATFGAPQSQTTSGSTLTIDLSAGQKHRITLASNITTVSITDPPGAGNFILEFVQDATGGRTITGWPSNVNWPGGVAPTFGDAATELRLVSLYYNGTTQDDYFGDYRPQTYS